MERGMIDKTGLLKIERKGIYKYQYCPSQKEEGNTCGDYCPLWEEYDRDHLWVHVCSRKTDIKIIEDLREGEEG